MTKKQTISVAIAAYNEALHITRCLDSVIDWVDEIVIYNAQSQDDTVKFIKKYPKVKLLSGPNRAMFHLNKMEAVDACHSDWILQLDADEVVSPELKSKILTTISNNPSENGFWVNRKNYFLGRFLTKGGLYPDPTIRLYRRGKGKLPCQSVHEQASIDGSIGHINADLLHYADLSFYLFLMRNNRYTTLIAYDLQQSKLPLNPATTVNYLFIKPALNFLWTYFRHKGFLDGFPGFVFIWFSSLRFPLSYIKYWESVVTKTPIDTLKSWQK